MSHNRSFIDLSSQFLSSLASVSPVGILHTDLDGRVSYINQRWTVISGQAAHDCQGFGWLNAIHPDDRQRVLQGWLHGADAAHEYMTNYRVVRPTGEVRHVHVRVAPVTGMGGERQGYVGSIEDVTDRQAAEVALRELRHAREESQRRIQALFDNSLDAIVFADDEGRYVDANPAACALFGCSYDDLLTKSIADVSVLDSPADFARAWRIFRERGRLSGEHVLRRADGSTRAVEFRAVADVLPGTHLSILRDITERQAAERAQQQYTKRLEILAAIDCAILATSSPDTIADAAVTQVAQLFPAVRVSVSLFDHPRRVAWIAALWSERPTQVVRGHQFPVLTESAPLLSDVRPLIVDNLAAVAQPTPVDSMLLAEGIRSYIRIPLCVQDEVIGSLNISSGEPRALSDHHLSVAQEIADRLAVALREARLFEDVQSSARQLSMLSKRLLEVQERERRDFARELHDDIGQLVTALKLQLGEVLEDATLAPSLRKLELLTDDLVATVRRVALNLRPPLLDEFGLSRALTAHFERFAAHTGIVVNLTARDVCARRFPLEVETAAFRIVQEALTNVARHAAVNTACVELTATADTVNIRVRDHGQGFEASQRSRSGSGLTGMQERVNLLGGTFSMLSRPGAGTTITATLPIASTRGAS